MKRQERIKPCTLILDERNDKYWHALHITTGLLQAKDIYGDIWKPEISLVGRTSRIS